MQLVIAGDELDAEVMPFERLLAGQPASART
jgi:hypothetical protein